MTNKELLEKLTTLINNKFDQYNKYLLNALKRIQKSNDTIYKNMATKEDIKELTKTIHLYMELTRVYIDKQKELDKEIDTILEYLGITDN